MGTTGEVMLINNMQLHIAVVRYYHRLDQLEDVITNNNLYLINNQYGSFVTNNDLGFRLAKNGQIDKNYRLTAEKKYLLKSQLRGRMIASEDIKYHCLDQLNETVKLIDQINQYLNP